MRESISISLPEAIKADLDSFSRRRGISRSEAVREAVEQYLFIEGFRARRAQLMPYAEAQGIFTDEDVFREIS
jgi:metal-responsive CopG/Arc/MetJ family transcriptional regulator